MGTNSQVPLAHRLERRHLLDAIRVEVLQLSKRTPQTNRPAGTEKPRSWKAMNETTYPWEGTTQTHRRAPSTLPRR
jgi:hypothetical protein